MGLITKERTSATVQVHDKTTKKPRRAKKPKSRNRVPRAENILQKKRESPNQILKPGLLKGQCKQNACGAEAACLPQTTDTYYCLCTSNGEPPTDDFKCPRSTVPLSPKPIHNINPPRTSKTTDLKYAESPTVAQSPKPLITAEGFAGPSATKEQTITDPTNQGAYLTVAATGGIFLLLLFLAVTIVLYFRRRMSLVNGKTQARMRPGEPLLADRYITNPQYGVCGAGTLGPGGAAPDQVKSDENESPLQHLDRNALTFLEEVGEGCFGKVHKGLLRTNSGEQVVAIKVLKESANRSAEEDFAREVKIMSAFRHPNILSLVGVVYREDINASPWMVFEYMEWGDLAGVLRGSRGGGRPAPALDAPALRHVALQVALGMRYLAAHRFVHRDLAARNCLVGARLAVKIADFGMSRDVYTCDYYKMGGERPMPVRWMSPESIIYARFTHESDVWSYGVVLWEIYSRGKQPFYGYNNDGATKRILQGIVLVPPEDCPRFACELMRSCWAADPRDRITFDEICKKLEAAEGEGGGNDTGTMRLPRPPPPQDSAGYLVPALVAPSDYIAPIPDSSSSEDEDDEEEYT